MATIPRKERRRSKGVDMATMMAMLDRFGPEAQQRQQMSQQMQQMQMQEMQMRQQRLQQEQEMQPVQQDLLRAQLAALQQGTQQQGAMAPFQQQQAQGAVEGQQAALQQQQAVMPFAAPAAGAALTGAHLQNAGMGLSLEQQAAQFAAQQPHLQGMAENAAMRDTLGTQTAQQMAPFGVNNAAIQNLMAGAEVAKMDQATQLMPQQVNNDLLGVMMKLAESNPQIAQMLDPATLQQMSGGLVRVPEPPMPLPQWREALLQAAQTNPAEAFNMYSQAPEQYQQAVPLSPEQLIELANNTPSQSLLQQQGVVQPEQGIWSSGIASTAETMGNTAMAGIYALLRRPLGLPEGPDYADIWNKGHANTREKLGQLMRKKVSSMNATAPSQ